MPVDALPLGEDGPVPGPSTGIDPELLYTGFDIVEDRVLFELTTEITLVATTE